jgi:extradiol dioxygenase family protein
MIRPFHYSFLVSDLAESRRFYGGLLGCAEGRSAPTWVDFDFFGSQVSLHLTDDVPAPRHWGKVDSIDVPMPHFGAVLRWADFHELAARLRESGLEFVIPPMVRFAGQPAEQATMFFRDPSGNAIELKAFRDEANLFAH